MLLSFYNLWHWIVQIVRKGASLDVCTLTSPGCLFQVCISLVWQTPQESCHRMELCLLFACQSHWHAHGKHMLTEHCEHDTFIMLSVHTQCVHMCVHIKLTLASFMLQSVLSWLPCCLVSQADIMFGVHWVPQNIPLKVIILQAWWSSCQSVSFGSHATFLSAFMLNNKKTVCWSHSVTHDSWSSLNTCADGSIIVI